LQSFVFFILVWFDNFLWSNEPLIIGNRYLASPS
jgi:hypothetical protein